MINALARKDHTEYDRLRAEAAKALGIRKGTLDDKVEAKREELRESAVEVPAHSPLGTPCGSAGSMGAGRPR